MKEFLYVDVDRTRSLLAQLQGGLVDQLTSETANTLDGLASAKFFGIGGSAGYSRQARHQESRSFQEVTFVAFEQLADAQELITELGDEFRDPGQWDDGRVHADLADGQLIRITCDVQLLDGALFRERITRVEKMVEGIATITTPAPTPRNSTPQERAKLPEGSKAAIRKKMMGGITGDQLGAISDFIEAFVGESIAFRALACGSDELSKGFGGTLLGRDEYIQQERDSLLSRYGTVASNWTSVMQVASIPARGSETPNLGGAPAGFDRAVMENMAVKVLGYMEAIGLVGGPQWPSISVTPLAIYRTVPRPAAGNP